PGSTFSLRVAEEPDNKAVVHNCLERNFGRPVPFIFEIAKKAPPKKQAAPLEPMPETLSEYEQMLSSSFGGGIRIEPVND
ncbi:MAG: hypothetical protein HGA54_05410, partial [Actinobacteria bacterium]|nr:hypothetical protein [Actinomycetota bacterium]